MQMEKARWVCTTCKARKKACDKVLPICSYCKKRQLNCKYDDDEESCAEIKRWTGADRSHIGGGTSILSNERYSLANERAAVDRIMHEQVCQIIRVTDMSTLEMSDQYFRGFHKVLPIISADILQDSLVRRDGSLPPPASLSLLILSMYLVTLNPSESKMPTMLSYYVTVKTSFSHVQALEISSIYMVQAGLLIAGYEYACSQPDAAYLSLGVSARMFALCSRRQAQGTENSMKTSVETNVAWGIIILERLILCEIDDVHEKLINDYPKVDFQLPSELEPRDAFRSMSTSSSPNVYSLSNISAITGGGNFRQQAKTVALLDEVLSAIRTSSEKESKQSDLTAIGAKLQDFLSAGLAENGWAWGASYGALAIIIRSLFLLHQNILRNLPSESIHSKSWQMSRDALNMATRIMIDTSHDHIDHGMPHNVDSIPLCGGYNLRCAVEHIETNYDVVNNSRYSDDLRTLAKLCDAFYTRWRPLGCRRD
ncbi:hypothetical protein BGW36DRAFT_216049 [Talaromyces proteolyticus]|uniref:Zn(2)-C6 fungal-type domain-containing protein n=1 Tax=Talaromyces proteolyticus TaxID=1131652 RepID=A0AAD4KLH5_9EURO|nr:uncharacterized protein BGW36DRAFT_216049 [Talaromyces proteolyticus]KAH8694093.1 hypothetical protein BGW36DRAFT_216049 [Talaromyces proteolyticus]